MSSGFYYVLMARFTLRPCCTAVQTSRFRKVTQNQPKQTNILNFRPLRTYFEENRPVVKLCYPRCFLFYPGEIDPFRKISCGIEFVFSIFTTRVWKHLGNSARLYTEVEKWIALVKPKFDVTTVECLIGKQRNQFSLRSPSRVPS